MYPRLRALAAVVGPVEEEPDDLVQEAVEKVLRRQGISDIIDPEAYLRRSIVNLASNRRRSLGRLRRARRRLGVGQVDRIGALDRRWRVAGFEERLFNRGFGKNRRVPPHPADLRSAPCASTRTATDSTASHVGEDPGDQQLNM